jgi:hypothetical protein
MMWCKMAFQKWNQILILLRDKERPNFYFNKVSWAIYIVMFSIVEVFDYLVAYYIFQFDLPA